MDMVDQDQDKNICIFLADPVSKRQTQLRVDCSVTGMQILHAAMAKINLKTPGQSSLLCNGRRIPREHTLAMHGIKSNMTLQIVGDGLFGGSNLPLLNSGGQDAPTRQASVSPEPDQYTPPKQDTDDDFITDDADAAMAMYLRQQSKQGLIMDISEDDATKLGEFQAQKGISDYQKDMLSQIILKQKNQQDQAQKSIEDMLKATLPDLSLLQTFKLITALSPSHATDLITDMTAAQQMLLIAIKSLRHVQPVEIIAKAVSSIKGDPSCDNLLIALRHQLSQHSGEFLERLLEKKSSPEQNLLLWRALTVKQMKVLCQDLSKSCTVNLLRNCEHEQIEQMMNQDFSEDQKAKIDRLRMQVRYERQNLSFDEHKAMHQAQIAKLPQYHSFWIMRPGTSGTEYLHFKKYKDQCITRYRLDDEAMYEEVAEKLSEVTIYRKPLGQEYISPVKTIYENIEIPPLSSWHYEIPMIAGRGDCKDIFCFTKQDNELKLSILKQGTQDFVHFKLPIEVEQRQLIRCQLLQDDQEHRIFVYSHLEKDTGESLLSFYDVNEERTIVTLRKVLCLLYVMPLQQSEAGTNLIFDKKKGAQVNFELARRNEKSIILDVNQDNEYVKFFEHTFDNDFHLAHGLNHQLFMDWEREKDRGFYSIDGKVEIAVCSSKTNIHRLSLIASSFGLQKQTTEIFRELKIQTPDKLRRMRKKSSTELVVDYPLVCFKNEDSLGTLFVSYADKDTANQRLISFQVPGEILLLEQITSHRPQPPPQEFEPVTSLSIAMLTHDAHEKAAYAIQFDFDSKLNGSQMLAKQNWNSRVTKLSLKPDQLNILSELKDLPSKAVFTRMCFERNENILRKMQAVFQADGQIFFLEEQLLKKVFEPTGSKSLHPVEILGQNRIIYAVQNHKKGSINLQTIDIDDGMPFDLGKLHVQSIVQWCLKSDLLYILDESLNFHSLRVLGLDLHNRSPSLHTESIISLQKNESLLQLRDQLIHTQVRMTESTIAVENRLFSLVSGKEIESVEGELLSLGSNILLTRNQDQLKLSSNPGSRDLKIGSERLWQSLKSAHQVSENLLLIQDLLDGWVLTTVNGERKMIPAELSKFLEHPCEAISSLTLARRCKIVLIYGPSHQREKAVELQLTQGAEIASIRHLSLHQIQNDFQEQKFWHLFFRRGQWYKENHAAYGADPENSADDILINHLGKIIQINKSKMVFKGVEIEKPRLIKAEPGKSDLDLIKFDQVSLKTTFAFLSNYFCWKNHNKVSYINLETQEFGEIDMSRSLAEESRIDACNPDSLIEAGMISDCMPKNLDRLGNYLQITCSNDRVYIYDFNLSNPAMVNEIVEVSKFYNPQKFVEMGIIPTNTFTIFDVRSKKETWLAEKLQQSSFGNLVFKSTFNPIHGGQTLSYIYNRSTGQDQYLVNSLLMASPIQHREDRQSIGIYTSGLFASFQGQTLLEIFSKDSLALNAMHEHLIEQIDEEADEIDQDLIRLGSVLQKRSLVEGEVSSLVTNLIQRPNLRDSVLKMGLLCPSYSILDSLIDQSTFQQMIPFMTNELVESLNDCQRKKDILESKFLTLGWPSDLDYLTCMSDSIDVSRQEIADLATQIGGEDDLQIQQVRATYMNMSWFHRNYKNFFAFVSILEENLPTGFFSSKFIILLLNYYWKDVQRQIIYRQLLPSFAFIVCAVSFFRRSIQLRDENASLSWFDIIWGTCTIILLLYLVRTEVMQVQQLISHKKGQDYFKSPANWIDMCSLTLTGLITILTLVQSEILPINAHRLLAAITSCMLILKVYDWLRLFETTSFYTQLVSLTLYNIIAFSILFFIALLMFGIPISMINLGRTNADDSTLVSPFFNNWLMDALMNQYMLSLGEFGTLTENSASESFETELILALFFMATFFVQITMLNMLIAIMGDSFDYSMENRERLDIMTKLEILSSQSATMRQTDTQEQLKTFMIVVEPQDQEGSQKDWEGSINKVTKLMKQSMIAQEKVLMKKLGKQQTEIAELTRNVRAVDTRFNSAIDDVKLNQDKMVERQVKMEERIAERQEKMMEMLEHIIQTNNREDIKF